MGTSRTYDAANRLVHDGTTALTYDANGNLTNDGTGSYTWDRANRLLSMGGHSYAYDGDGRRISQTVSSVVTQYLLDTQPGLSVVLSQTVDDTDTTHYVHGPRGLHAVQEPAGEWQYPVTDGLGSVRGYLDPTGGVLSSVHYGEWGVPSAGIVGPAFTGEWRDANGLQYHRARYYAPGLAVWTALDPWEGLHERPMSLNGYSWVEGQVVNATDAGGEMPAICGSLTTACAAAIAFPGDVIIGDVVLCGATIACYLAARYTISQAIAAIAELAGVAFAEVERILGIGSGSNLLTPFDLSCVSALAVLAQSQAIPAPAPVPGAPPRPAEGEGSGRSLRDVLDRLPLRQLARWYLLRHLLDQPIDRTVESTPRRHISLGVQGLEMFLNRFTINLNVLYNPFNITVHAFGQVIDFGSTTYPPPEYPGWHEVGLTPYVPEWMKQLRLQSLVYN